MRLGLRVVPNAERDIRKAASWWQANRPAAPALFYRELQRAFETITTEPGIGPVVQDAELTGVRRIHLSRIHYFLYYHLKDDIVEVLALWHTSRGEAPPV